MIDLLAENLKWIINNIQWIFSGIGVLIISLFLTKFIKEKKNETTRINFSFPRHKDDAEKSKQEAEGKGIAQASHGSTANVINIQGIPPEEYQRLSEDFGITKNAVKNFFKIIEQKEIPKEDWDFTLRQIATRHKELLSRLDQFNVTVDTKIQELRLKAEESISEGDYDNADKYLDKALERQMFCITNAEKELTNCKLSAAEMKVNKGDIELIRINYKAATKLFKEAVELVPGGHELKKAEYSQKWGDAARDAGFYTESQTALEQCLEIRQKLLPKYHPDIATTFNNLAVLYKSQGKYEETEPMYQISLGIYETVLGKDHPYVATTLNNLAGLYKSQGKDKDPEPLYKRSLRIREAKFGKDHTDVATTINNLAGLYSFQGKYKKAELLYQRCLEIRETKLGKDHPDVATTINNLARLYSFQGKYEEAEPLYKRSLGVYEKALGKDHPNYKIFLQNYSLMLNKKEHQK
ncbi:NB-ARC domain-containing protein [Candidatus Magnetomorum sp. HK-1]|nr:NB-ARC domain-containing protein [Candidatus Magnetomorum sp. HK-1]